MKCSVPCCHRTVERPTRYAAPRRCKPCIVDLCRLAVLTEDELDEAERRASLKLSRISIARKVMVELRSMVPS